MVTDASAQVLEGRMSDKLKNCVLIGLLVGRLVGWFVGSFVCWRFSLMVGWLAG